MQSLSRWSAADVPPDQHHLVAVHHLAAVLRREVAGLPAEEGRHLAGVVGDQPAGDHGAVRAVRERHASLLAAGITGVTGDFLADDPVELVGPDGVVVARGLVAYDAREMPALLGRKTGDLAPEYRREVVHRDEMVLVGRYVGR